MKTAQLQNKNLSGFFKKFLTPIASFFLIICTVISFAGAAESKDEEKINLVQSMARVYPNSPITRPFLIWVVESDSPNCVAYTAMTLLWPKGERKWWPSDFSRDFSLNLIRRFLPTDREVATRVHQESILTSAIGLAHQGRDPTKVEGFSDLPDHLKIQLVQQAMFNSVPVINGERAVPQREPMALSPQKTAEEYLYSLDFIQRKVRKILNTADEQADNC